MMISFMILIWFIDGFIMNYCDEMNERRSVEEVWLGKTVIKELLSSHEGESLSPHNAFADVAV